MKKSRKAVGCWELEQKEQGRTQKGEGRGRHKTLGLGGLGMGDGRCPAALS